jgi:hypothetical protein
VAGARHEEGEAGEAGGRGGHHRADADARDGEAGERRAREHADRRSDVQDGVALAQQVGRLEHRHRCRARDRAGDGGERAVQEGEREDDRQPEEGGLERQDAEQRRLDHVDGHEHARHGQAVQPCAQGGDDEGGEELRGDEQGGRRERVARLVVDEDRQRNRRHPLGDAVEAVRGGEAPEPGHAQ